MYRFGSPITFFNAAFFKRRVLAAADAAGPALRWFVLDAIPVTSVDVTGLYTLREVRRALQTRGVTLVIAGRKTEYVNWLTAVGLYHPEDAPAFFPTLRQAFRAFHEAQERTPAG
jgi:MFS superfamily sulfate permease-like transporter